MTDQIKLDDCPEVLKTAVKDELARLSDRFCTAEIISCVVNKPINGANTTYKVYILNLNTFTVLAYIDNPKYYDIGVMRDMVTIGDIKEIIRVMPECFKY